MFLATNQRIIYAMLFGLGLCFYLALFCVFSFRLIIQNIDEFFGIVCI